MLKPANSGATDLFGPGKRAEGAINRDIFIQDPKAAEVRDEARAFARRVDLAILWKKHIAAKAVHGFYRMSKTLTTIDAGEQFETHVSDMKRLHRITGRRKAAPALGGRADPGHEEVTPGKRGEAARPLPSHKNGTKKDIRH